MGRRPRPTRAREHEDNAVSNEIKATELQIARLELRPGDVLVAKVSSMLTADMRARIMSALTDAVKYFGPEVKTLVVSRDVDLAVLRREQVEALSWSPVCPCSGGRAIGARSISRRGTRRTA